MHPEQRSAGIDLLRGICVLLVVLHHVHLRFRIFKFDVGGLLPESIGKVVFSSGYFAVITFFVISGFLITNLSLRRWGGLDRMDIRRFYWLRFARIAPCLLLLVALLSTLHLMGASGFVIAPERAGLGQAVLAALTFHVNWLEGHHGYLPGTWDVLWSLSVEEVFYLLFPVACLLLRRERWLVAALLMLIVIGPINRTLLAGQIPWEDYAYLSCADAIAFGCLAALVATRTNPTPFASRAMMTLGIACVLLIIVFRRLAWLSGVHSVGLGVSVLALGVALVLVPMAHGVGAGLLMRGTGFMRMVGRSSYEIYLTHMLVILGLMPLVVASNPSTTMIPVWYGALVMLSIALGAMVRRCYSDPINVTLRSRPIGLGQNEAQLATDSK